MARSTESMKTIDVVQVEGLAATPTYRIPVSRVRRVIVEVSEHAVIEVRASDEPHGRALARQVLEDLQGRMTWMEDGPLVIRPHEGDVVRLDLAERERDS